MPKKKNHYRVLGIPPNATYRTISDSYAYAMREDRASKKSASNDVENSEELTIAYRILIDPNKRESLDNETYAREKQYNESIGFHVRRTPGPTYKDESERKADLEWTIRHKKNRADSRFANHMKKFDRATTIGVNVWFGLAVIILAVVTFSGYPVIEYLLRNLIYSLVLILILGTVSLFWLIFVNIWVLDISFRLENTTYMIQRPNLERRSMITGDILAVAAAVGTPIIVCVWLLFSLIILDGNCKWFECGVTV